MGTVIRIKAPLRHDDDDDRDHDRKSQYSDSSTDHSQFTSYNDVVRLPSWRLRRRVLLFLLTVTYCNFIMNTLWTRRSDGSTSSTSLPVSQVLVSAQYLYLGNNNYQRRNPKNMKCDISNNPVHTFQYNSTSGLYNRITTTIENVNDEEIVDDSSSTLNNPWYSRSLLSSTVPLNDGSNDPRSMLRQRQQQHQRQVYSLTFYPQVHANNNEEEYLSNFTSISTNGSIDRPNIITVKECSCMFKNITTKVTRNRPDDPQPYEYQNRYYCLSHYDLCYIPFNDVNDNNNTSSLSSSFYAPVCYNDPMTVRVARSVFRPAILMYSFIIAFLLLTTMGRQAIGGFMSLILGPCWWDRYIVTYLMERKPRTAHHLIQQHLAYQSRVQDHQAEQEQNLHNQSYTARFKYKFRSLVQWIRKYILLQPPSTTVTPPPIVQSSETIENQQRTDTIEERDNDNQNNEYENTTEIRNMRTNTPHLIEYEIRTKRYNPKTTTTALSECDDEIVITANSTLSQSSAKSENDKRNVEINCDDNTTTNNSIRKEFGGIRSNPEGDDDTERSSIRQSGMMVCSICLLEIKAGTKIGNLPCHHIFHIYCLKTWIKRRNVCPLCLHPDIAKRRRDLGTITTITIQPGNNEDQQQQQQQDAIQTIVNPSPSIVAVRSSRRSQSANGTSPTRMIMAIRMPNVNGRSNCSNH